MWTLFHERLGQLVLERHKLPIGNPLPPVAQTDSQQFASFQLAVDLVFDFPASLPNSETGRLFGDS